LTVNLAIAASEIHFPARVYHKIEARQPGRASSPNPSTGTPSVTVTGLLFPYSAQLISLIAPIAFPVFITGNSVKKLGNEGFGAVNRPQIVQKAVISLLFPCLTGNSGGAWLGIGWDHSQFYDIGAFPIQNCSLLRPATPKSYDCYLEKLAESLPPLCAEITAAGTSRDRRLRSALEAAFLTSRRIEWALGAFWDQRQRLAASRRFYRRRVHPKAVSSRNCAAS